MSQAFPSYICIPYLQYIFQINLCLCRMHSPHLLYSIHGFLSANNNNKSTFYF